MTVPFFVFFCLKVLLHLNRAIKANHFDSAVVGSAMKRCEQGRWWDCLCQVRLLQTRHQVEMTDVTWTAIGDGLSLRGDTPKHGIFKGQHETSRFGMSYFVTQNRMA